MGNDICKQNYSELMEYFSNINKLEHPEIKSKRKTFFDITGYPHYENVLSNILAFYLDKTEEHNFDDLFMSSLLEIIYNKSKIEFDFVDWSIEREYETEKGRIDLLISSGLNKIENPFAIIIEIKVYSSLNNPTDDYIDSFNDIKEENKIGVLLTIFEVSPPPKFINITHQELFDNILKNINYYFIESDDRHLLFLKDIYNNIINLTGVKEMKDLIKFYTENGTKYEEINKIRQVIISALCNIIKQTEFQLTNLTGNSVNKEEIWEYIDNNKKSWIKFIHTEIFSKRKLTLEIGIMTQEIDFKKIEGNEEIDSLLTVNKIRKNKYYNTNHFVWLTKSYEELNDENLISYQEYIKDIFFKEWDKTCKLIINNLVYKN